MFKNQITPEEPVLSCMSTRKWVRFLSWHGKGWGFSVGQGTAYQYHAWVVWPPCPTNAHPTHARSPCSVYSTLLSVVCVLYVVSQLLIVPECNACIEDVRTFFSGSIGPPDESLQHFLLRLWLPLPLQTLLSRWLQKRWLHQRACSPVLLRSRSPCAWSVGRFPLYSRESEGFNPDACWFWMRHAWYTCSGSMNSHCTASASPTSPVLVCYRGTCNTCMLSRDLQYLSYIR